MNRLDLFSPCQGHTDVPGEYLGRIDRTHWFEGSHEAIAEDHVPESMEGDPESKFPKKTCYWTGN